MKDKKTQYSKMALNESLLKLLKKKPLHKIKIKEICEDAQVNRSTFYRYYANQFDQCNSILEDLFLDTLQYLIHTDDQWSDESFEIVENYCKYYYKNRILFLTVANAISHEEFSKVYKKVYKDKMFSLWDDSNYNFDEKTREYVVEFIINTQKAVLIKWLTEDYDKYSPQEIASFFHRINSSALQMIVNIKN